MNPELLRLAYRLTQNAEEALEIRQLAFLRIHAALSDFRGAAQLETWLYRVVLNLCRDRLRQRLLREGAQVRAATEAAAGGGCEESTPVREAEARERGVIVAQAVGALPEREREVVVLRHYEGLSFPRIAEILETPVTTVKSRMTRGFERLRACLAELDS